MPDGEADDAPLLSEKLRAVRRIRVRAGNAFDCDDQVAGDQSGCFRAAAGEDRIKQNAVFGVEDRSADARNGGIALDGRQEGLILLLRHVIGVRVADDGEELLQRFGVIRSCRDVVDICLLQKIQRVFHAQRGCRRNEQRTDTQKGAESAQQSFHGQVSFAVKV